MKLGEWLLVGIGAIWLFCLAGLLWECYRLERDLARIAETAIRELLRRRHG